MKVYVVRVFVDDDGEHGTHHGIVLTEGRLDEEACAAAAYRLGYAETVFVDISQPVPQTIIQSLTGQVPFAGSALVGAAWLLGEIGTFPTSLGTSAGAVPCWRVGADVWIRGQLRTLPAWWHEYVASPDQLRAISDVVPSVQDATQLWTWENEREGRVLARTFASRFGIKEEEACGSASMLLSAALGRHLVVRHGEGSRILVQPNSPGHGDIGGGVRRGNDRRV